MKHRRARRRAAAELGVSYVQNVAQQPELLSNVTLAPAKPASAIWLYLLYALGVAAALVLNWS